MTMFRTLTAHELKAILDAHRLWRSSEGKEGSRAPNSNRPAERRFLGIGKGSTPATNQVAAISEGWINEWLAAHVAAEEAGK